ncbi:MAG: flavin reductase (DIM6/NTAB) family NADH-FMN oxidoreductase RutF [Cyclobacteriaceae bacterium]|jgi:flavin reductase (DIM6/NTAB) family NADH-FMN oxidoreductase RutF
MRHYSKKDIQNADFIFRLNLVNSITGIKPANLIGSVSKNGQTNLAIFSSVIHLGSDPALIGFIMRPNADVPRHTYDNIISTKKYTINHIHGSFVEKAHYTSVKFSEDQSEFDECALTHEYLNDFEAPFVKESNLKFGLKLVDDILIKKNGTHLIIGEIQHLNIDEDCVGLDGLVDLEAAKDVGISGLNQYYSLTKLKKIPYARLSELPDFKSKKRPDNVVFNDDTQSYHSSILPYGTNIGAPSISPSGVSSWKASSITGFNHTFNNKIESLKDEYEKLIEQYNTNDMLYSAKMNFEPIIGQTYHLYLDEKKDEQFLSLIPPKSWKQNHKGDFKLNHDKVWVKMDG